MNELSVLETVPWRVSQPPLFETVSSPSHFLQQPQSSQLASLIDWLEMSPSEASSLMTVLGAFSDLIKGPRKILPPPHTLSLSVLSLTADNCCDNSL